MDSFEMYDAVVGSIMNGSMALLYQGRPPEVTLRITSAMWDAIIDSQTGVCPTYPIHCPISHGPKKNQLWGADVDVFESAEFWAAAYPTP